MKRQRIWGAVGALVILVALGGLFGYQQLHRADDGSPRGGPVELPSTQGDFSLTQLEDDQLAVLFFGYTHCPDVCPMSLSVMRQVMQGLDEDQRRRVVPLLVSLDPERDTLARLGEYVGYFGDAFIGATGSQAQLEELAERYGVVWRRVETPDSAMAYTIDHSSSLYLVDRDGTIRQRVLYSPTPHALRAALEQELGG
ncbi:SCO family protein [Halomonas sp. MCCC 1A17488]|uniref:SCO family protein n=1 Tax=unclassified Halomonas TaxID=2609666 RepID=UPI0018D26CB1|nr:MULTISPECIES: SCO family protein [unclassified Halomonas]MCE8017416.1 SCO family protein [Halomonas sp. MCCC 1A17488]MCG3240749.1 SCO family protein [Halomonas sp. MCCC 1A17488]QPP49413.1 SCO family protein [Halomonas sp. SS10-MC5]